MINVGLMSSDRPDWNTPENLLAVVRRFDVIGLDPCSNAASIVGAELSWDVYSLLDSLHRDWCGAGLVYVNPPYGREIGDWTSKCASSGAEVIALLPARTDARWWHEDVGRADAVCLWRGRLRFVGAPSSAPFPSAVVYWGSRPDRFTEIFGDFGMVFLLTAHKQHG